MKNIFLTVLTVFFFILVAYLFFDRISAIDIDDLKKGFSFIGPTVVLTSLLLVGMNYLVLSSFDYFAFKNFGPSFMSYPKVLISAFVCYAFTINIGAFVGGLGFRYRIYPRWHVSIKKIPYIILSSIIANWSGYILLLSGMFLIRPPGTEIISFLPVWTMSLLGCIGILIIAAHLYLSFKRARLKFGKLDFQFPRLSHALIQLLLSTCQWGFLGLIIFLFMNELGVGMNYSEVMLTVLLASIAGVITHIPAGMGVIETLFLRIGPESQSSKILVALICYRTVYYLLPLLIAVPTYFLLELRQRKHHPGGHYVK